MKYNLLLNVLEAIRGEAPARFARYHHQDSDEEQKSRLFIHLLLKVSFGVMEFEQRERLITDGAYDGGIDGYYIDAATKAVYLIQSKFRATEANFASKLMPLEDVLKMDTARILKGEGADESGNEYNGKIRQLQRELGDIPDIARYRYEVVLLANISKDITASKLTQLVGGLPVTVLDHEKCYTQLVFPVASGTHFTATDIHIPIDLSNKNAGSKISYTVSTSASECEITVLFVPAIEIAQIMNKYKNSILKYNPRSFLELEGKSVNNAIRATIVDSSTNEFALFNNGITMLSDETYFNERIGQKNKAQLHVVNPQIINGGQTSYVLSRILAELPADDAAKTFRDKEVLLKVITLVGCSCGDDEKLRLIDAISEATNKQTAVFDADRVSNDSLHKAIQAKVFHRLGLLYERKRGEFADGVQNGYVKSQHIVDRNLFLRLFHTVNGDLLRASQKRPFRGAIKAGIDITDDNTFDSISVALSAYRVFDARRHRFSGGEINTVTFAKVFVFVQLYSPSEVSTMDPDALSHAIDSVEIWWDSFLAKMRAVSGRWIRSRIDKATGATVVHFNVRGFVRSSDFRTIVASELDQLRAKSRSSATTG